MSEKSQSTWLWVALGCIGIVFLIAVGVVGALIWGGKKMTKAVEEMRDPKARRSGVERILGADSLPPGYHPMVGFGIPFVLDVALLSDREPDASGEPQGFGEHGFVYLKMLSFGRQQKELEDFFEGRSDDPEALRHARINVRVREVVARGKISRRGEGPGEADIRWVANRGDVDAVSSGRREGLITLMMFECQGRRQKRLGIWFGADVEPPPSGSRQSGPSNEVEAAYAGSVADPAAIEAFTSYFKPCSAS